MGWGARRADIARLLASGLAGHGDARAADLPAWRRGRAKKSMANRTCHHDVPAIRAQAFRALAWRGVAKEVAECGRGAGRKGYSVEGCCCAHCSWDAGPMGLPPRSLRSPDGPKTYRRLRIRFLSTMVSTLTSAVATCATAR